MLAFVRVAESGSFTSAAAQLGVSVSAVAKAVARLEEELGAQLLARSTRRMALNDDGREFYARCQQILNDIEDAEASVKSAGETPKGRLRMALPVLFGRLTLLPRIAEFNARYPEIVVDLSLRGPAGGPHRARPRHRRAGGQPQRFPLHLARAEPRTAGDGGVPRVPEAPRRAADARRSRGAQLHRVHLRPHLAVQRPRHPHRGAGARQPRRHRRRRPARGRAARARHRRNRTGGRCGTISPWAR